MVDNVAVYVLKGAKRAFVKRYELIVYPEVGCTEVDAFG
jgi:hypothetical protein